MNSCDKCLNKKTCEFLSARKFFDVDDCKEFKAFSNAFEWYDPKYKMPDKNDERNILVYFCYPNGILEGDTEPYYTFDCFNKYNRDSRLCDDTNSNKKAIAWCYIDAPIIPKVTNGIDIKIHLSEKIDYCD